MSLGNLSTGSISHSTPASIAINAMTVVTEADFATGDLNIRTLTQSTVAKGPLVSNITATVAHFKRRT